MKNIKKFLGVVFVFSFFVGGQALADVSLTIRDGNTILFEGSIPLPEAETVELTDSEGAPHDIGGNTVLSLIHAGDLASEDFSISELKYFADFDSLYLNCLTGSTGEKCDDWQYVVDGQYPGSGMDQETLSGDETVYLYYGQQNRVTLSASAITTTDTLTVTAEEYDYENNSWTPRAGATVGLTQPNQDDPWTPIEVQTAAASGAGEATFSEIPAGDYNVGIKEDFYFPTEELNVTNASASSSGGGGSGGGSSSKKTSASKTESPTDQFDTEKAFEYLISKQKENGSFGEGLYADWAALALATGNDEAAKAKLLRHYTTSNSPLTSLTDLERRSMALMALSLNPYSINGKNYIRQIVEYFDGKQFGDPSLYNDDIFALIVLANTGWTKEDDSVSKALLFIMDKQAADGSWSQSVDMTGAAITALSIFPADSRMHNSMQKAKAFLRLNQNEDGGFGNVSSTAWAIEGILAMGEDPIDWKHEKKNKSPLDYLEKNQEEDGGVENENETMRLWETSYALTSLSGKTWNEIMSKFEKQEIPQIKIETSADASIKSANMFSTKKAATSAPAIKSAEEKTENENETEAGSVESSLLGATAIKADISTSSEKSWFKSLWQTIFGIR